MAAGPIDFPKYQDQNMLSAQELAMLIWAMIVLAGLIVNLLTVIALSAISTCQLRLMLISVTRTND